MLRCTLVFMTMKDRYLKNNMHIIRTYDVHEKVLKF